MIGEIPPGLILIVGALAVPLLRGWLRAGWLLALPILALVQTLGLEHGSYGALSLFGLELTTLRIDALSLPFGFVFMVAFFVATIYQLHVPGALQPVASLVYAGSALGAVFAGDLVTLFVFWEGTSISSVFLIFASGTQRALAVGMRYLIFQISSGVLLLAGAMVHFGETGSIAFDSFDPGSTAGTLMLLAFGIKTAFPLLHGWLKDAYPEATVTGTVVLSIFTTKLAIYALARGFAGTEILVPIGATMAAFPIFWALVEDDFRRVLAWALNSQLGFMVTGIGIGTDLALNGAVAHAAASMLYQSLLFMGTGAVLLRTGTARGSELSGVARDMPWTAAFYGIAAVSIGAFPLTIGFVSKAMTISAAGYQELFWPWLILLAASAMAFVIAGLRIPFVMFLGERSTRRAVGEAPINMLVAMASGAALCIGIGVFPAPLYALLPGDYDYKPYTVEHVITQVQLLVAAALAFALLWRLGVFPRAVPGVVVDPDRLWRRPAAWLAGGALDGALRGWGALTGRGSAASLRLIDALYRQHGPAGRLARTRPSGSIALWMAVLLAAFLIFSFF
jgi:multicomponent Na+:H+ antiporter subunit D